MPYAHSAPLCHAQSKAIWLLLPPLWGVALYNMLMSMGIFQGPPLFDTILLETFSCLLPCPPTLRHSSPKVYQLISYSLAQPPTIGVAQTGAQ